MDPLLQKGIDCKWLFDSRDEACGALTLAMKHYSFLDVTYKGETKSAVDLSFCLSWSAAIKQRGDKFQCYVEIFTFVLPDEAIQSANPYGIPVYTNITACIDI